MLNCLKSAFGRRTMEIDVFLLLLFFFVWNQIINSGLTSLYIKWLCAIKISNKISLVIIIFLLILPIWLTSLCQQVACNRQIAFDGWGVSLLYLLFHFFFVLYLFCLSWFLFFFELFRFVSINYSNYYI